MKHIIFFTILFFSFLSFQTKAQILMKANHTFKITNDTLTIYQSAYFSNGAPGICPIIDSVNFNINDDIIILFVRYDDRGIFPTMGCGTLDTLSHKIPEIGQYTLIVNSNSYQYNSDSENYETVQVDSDTSYAVKVDVTEITSSKQNGVTLYPNPANHQVQIKTTTRATITTITLFDVLGNEVRQFAPNNTLLDLTNVPAGNYFLKINTEQGMLVEKLLIE